MNEAVGWSAECVIVAFLSYKPRMYTTWIGHISFFTNIIAYA